MKKFTQSELKKLLINLTCTAERIDSQTTRLEQWDTCYKALKDLEIFPVLAHDVKKVLEINHNFSLCEPFILVSTTSYRDFNTVITHIRTKLQAVIDYMEITGVEIKEGYGNIEILLPADISFEELQKISSEFNFIFTESSIFDEEVLLNEVKSGSIWLIITISLGAVALLGGISKLALELRKKHIENKIILEQLKSLKSVNNLNEKIKEELEEKFKIESMHFAERFKKENKDKLKDRKTKEEDLIAISFSIQKLSDLFIQGVKIVSSVDNSTAKELKELPSVEDYRLLEKNIKLLSDKK